MIRPVQLAHALVQIANLGQMVETDDVVLDLANLAIVWPDPEDFEAAVSSTCRAIRQVSDDAVDTSGLTYQLEGWNGYHYQLRPERHTPADLRLVYRPCEPGRIEVLAFGHRKEPDSVYLKAKRRAVTR